MHPDPYRPSSVPLHILGHVDELRGVPHLVLEYQQLARDPQQRFDEEIWESLGLPPAPVGTVLRRQSRGRWQAGVVNHESLRPLIESSEAELELIAGPR